jgi:hypothetical protein
MSRAKCFGALLGSAALVGVTVLTTVTPAYASAKHAVRPSVSVTAQPAKVTANGLSRSRVDVKVKLGKKADAYASVKLSETRDAKGSCGRLDHFQGRTNRDGILQLWYNSSTRVGFCKIGAAVGKGTGSVSIDQMSPFAKVPYLITLAAQSTQLSANGSATTTLTASVTNGGAAVSGDPVLLASVASKSGSCGLVALGSASTNSSGQVTAVYTASSVQGSCKFHAIEAFSGSSSGEITIQQS